MLKRLKSESGYSLVEVMVAIMLLAIAIIPMVGMFDAGLRASTQGGNLDQARALANQQMEKVMALRYSEVVATYPPPTPACDISLPEGFTCQMNTYYVTQDTLQRPSPALTSGNTMEIVVTIRRSEGTTNYTVNGLKSKGSNSQ